jgi:hypothetical protein
MGLFFKAGTVVPNPCQADQGFIERYRGLSFLASVNFEFFAKPHSSIPRFFKFATD